VLVPAEPDPHTFNLEAESAAQATTAKTKAILAVNLYGQPVNYESLRTLATDEGLHLMIDNAQAQGARFKGQPVGGWPTSNATAFIQQRISEPSAKQEQSRRIERTSRIRFDSCEIMDPRRDTTMRYLE